MKIEFPALDSDTLVYFLYHSGVFVFALAGVFLFLGVGIGYAFWGRYKKRAHLLTEESEGQKGEIADLKRKLAEQALRPLPAVEPAPVSQPQPPQPEPAPPPAFVPAPLIQDLPAMPELAANLPPPNEPVSRPPARIARPRPMAPVPAVATPARASRVEAAAIAPFSFLMDEPGQEPPASED